MGHPTTARDTLADVSDSTLDPIRKIKLAFGGDAWAALGTQTAPALTADLPRIRITSGAPLRYRLVGYDGGGPDASEVVGDVSTASTTVAKIRMDRRGNETLAQTVPTAQIATGAQVTEVDVSAAELVLIGIVGAVVVDTATWIWIFMDAGGTKVQVA